MKKHIVSILLITFVITGCASPKLVDPIATLQENTNNQIQLYSFDFFNTYKTLDAISAQIWNMTENSIEFPDDSNIRIFEKTRNGWVEIFEKPVTRIPPGPFTINPVGESQSIRMVGIVPDLPDTGRKYDLRVYVSGLMQENGETIEVFAYTDVTLKP